MCVCVCVYDSACILMYMHVYLSIHPFIHPSIHLSISRKLGYAETIKNYNM